MAKLRWQVLILAACLVGVLAAKHYVDKIAAMAPADGGEASTEAAPLATGAATGDGAGSDVQLPAKAP